MERWRYIVHIVAQSISISSQTWRLQVASRIATQGYESHLSPRLSEAGANMIKRHLTMQADNRPTFEQLLQDPWINLQKQQIVKGATNEEPVQQVLLVID